MSHVIRDSIGAEVPDLLQALAEDPAEGYLLTVIYLEAKYGGVDRMLRFSLKELRELPTAGPDNWAEFCRLHRSVKAFQSKARAAGQPDAFTSPDLLEVIESKLGPAFQEQFLDWIYRQGHRIYNATHFVAWADIKSKTMDRLHERQCLGLPGTSPLPTGLALETTPSREYSSTILATAAAAPPHATAAQQANPCQCCNRGVHRFVDCDKYRSLTPLQRRSFLTGVGRCTRCLRGHPVKVCPSVSRCRTCNDTHHSSLHEDRTPAASPQ